MTSDQAEYLIEEWLSMDLENELLDLLWKEVNDIFIEHEYPVLHASLFFIKKAYVLRDHLSDMALKGMLLESLYWLTGEKVNVPIDSPLLLSELRRALYLMESDPLVINDISQSKVLI